MSNHKMSLAVEALENAIDLMTETGHMLAGHGTLSEQLKVIISDANTVLDKVYALHTRLSRGRK